MAFDPSLYAPEILDALESVRLGSDTLAQDTAAQAAAKQALLVAQNVADQASTTVVADQTQLDTNKQHLIDQLNASFAGALPCVPPTPVTPVDPAPVDPVEPELPVEPEQPADDGTTMTLRRAA